MSEKGPGGRGAGGAREAPPRHVVRESDQEGSERRHAAPQQVEAEESGQQREAELEGLIARCGEMWGDAGRYGEVKEMWGDTGRYGEVRGDLA